MSIVNAVYADNFIKTYSTCAGNASKIGVWESREAQKKESVVDQYKKDTQRMLLMWNSK